jgi:hypothetical protein
MHKRLRKKSAVFSGKLCDELTRLTGHAWQCEFPLNGTSGRADVGLDQGDGRYILVEVELRRRLPAHNVLKTWFWASKQKLRPQFQLIHVVSKYYNSKKTFMEQTDFLAKQMELALKNVRYKRIESEFAPVKGTIGIGGAGKLHALKVAEKIVEYLRAERILKGKAAAASA